MLTKDDYKKILTNLKDARKTLYLNIYNLNAGFYLERKQTLDYLINKIEGICELELFDETNQPPDTNIHLKDFRATTRNIDTLEINLGIRLKDFQYIYLRGYKQALNGDIARGSGKTYIRTLAYTLGLIDKKELLSKELTHNSVVKNVDNLNYLIDLNKHFIDKLRKIEERDYYLHQLKGGERS